MRLQEEILTVDELRAAFPGRQRQPPRVLVQHLGNDLSVGLLTATVFGRLAGEHAILLVSDRD